jgi:hypothetical protein
MLSTAKPRAAVAQNLKADPQADSRRDLSTELNIGLRIELGMERGVATDSGPYAGRLQALGLVFGLENTSTVNFIGTRA